MPVFEVEANGKSFEVEAPDINSATTALKTHFGTPATPEFEGSVAGDVAKSAGIGVVKGGLGLAGLPADAVDLATRGVDYLAGTKSNEAFGKTVGDYAGSGALRGYLEQATGPLYEPKTGVGQVAQTIGEFAPAALAGPAGIGRRVATQVLAPALASEAAGAAAQGTDAEPYARVAGAIGGAGGASKLARAVDAKAAAKAVPSAAQVDDAISAGYNTQAIKDVRYAPAAVEKVADRIQTNLKGQYFDAPQTYKQLDLMKTPMNGPTHSIQDIDNVRRRLNELRGAGGAEGEAAKQAVQFIDNVLPHIGKMKGAVVAGDARAAAVDLKGARANAAAQFRAERIQEIIEKAQNNAGASHSGGNLENELRKGVRSLLNSKNGTRGFTEPEKAALQAFARGSVSANILRRVGKILGGGGGLGQLASGAAGSAALGPVGMIAFPAVGMAANKLGASLAKGDLNDIMGQLRRRSPAGAAIPQPLPVPQLSATNNALLSAALARPLQLQPFENYAGR
jgi:hypothetical protein